MSREIHSGRMDRREPLGQTVFQTKKSDLRVGGVQRRRYKLVPEEWRALPTIRFRQAISHMEAVLLEISTDGSPRANPFGGEITAKTLDRWADHIRAALKELTR